MFHQEISIYRARGQRRPVRPCGRKQAVEPSLQHTLSKFCVSLKRCRVSGQPRGADRDATNDLIVGTSSRQRLNASPAESIMRRLIGDDAKHLTTALECPLWSPVIAHSVPQSCRLLECAITGRPLAAHVPPGSWGRVAMENWFDAISEQFCTQLS